MNKNTIKPEMTVEAKARFFALYWGQCVIRHMDWTTRKTEILGVNRITIVEQYCIELKPLSSITDEDAIEVARIIKPNYDHHHDVKTGRYLIKGLDNTLQSWVKYLPLVDFLRSKSYALPFMGWSVEEMVEAGWLKLKGGSNE